MKRFAPSGPLGKQTKKSWKQLLQVLYLICFSIILTEGDGQKTFHFPTLKEQEQVGHQKNRLKCHSSEHPILKSVYLITLLQKLNCSLSLRFIRVSFNIIKVRKTGTQRIILTILQELHKEPSAASNTCMDWLV